MKQIENLPWLVNAAEGMRNFFNAFNGIDDVIKALEAAQNYPAELDAAIKEKRDTVAHLADEGNNLHSVVKKLTEEKADLEKTIASLQTQLKKKMIENEQRENFELEKVRKANNDAVESSLKTMKYELENHKRIIAESEDDMQDKLEEFDARLKAKAQEERELNERIEGARKTLLSLRERLEV